MSTSEALGVRWRSPRLAAIHPAPRCRSRPPRARRSDPAREPDVRGRERRDVRRHRDRRRAGGHLRARRHRGVLLHRPRADRPDSVPDQERRRPRELRRRLALGDRDDHGVLRRAGAGAVGEPAPARAPPAGGHGTGTATSTITVGSALPDARGRDREPAAHHQPAPGHDHGQRVRRASATPCRTCPSSSRSAPSPDSRRRSTAAARRVTPTRTARRSTRCARAPRPGASQKTVTVTATRRDRHRRRTVTVFID